MTSPAKALISPLLRDAGFRHAFFTRGGGVSEGPYASLSFSVAAGDVPEHVEENLNRAAALLGVAPERMYFLSQTHGTDLREVTGVEDRSEVLHLEGDAVWSDSPAVACAVRSADCVPVLLADRRSGRVAAIHAGWRGVAAGIVPSVISRLATDRRPEWLVAIGPHISVEAFEVGEDVAQALEAASPSAKSVDRTSWSKPHVDLRLILHAQLADVGVAPAAVDDVFGCTHGDRARFFSFRRDGRLSGRHLSAIVPRGILA